MIDPKPTSSTRSEVLVEHEFAAPRNLAWAAWTDPVHAVHWYGPRGYTTPVCEMDVRTGGAFRLCMRSPKGIDCWEEGVFRQVIPERLLESVYHVTYNGERGGELSTSVRFEDHGSGAKLIVRQSLDNDNFTRDAEEGTRQTLQRLAAYLEKLLTPHAQSSGGKS
jgi:uncharacterized protein YndB with AHSA1/START domain